MIKSQTYRLLGYPVDARLLIINADDFGTCNSVNEAIFQIMREGFVRSTNLMVPSDIDKARKWLMERQTTESNATLD